MKSTFPTVLVILGGTGDLVQRKIVPALYNLYVKGRLPNQFRVVGFAHTDHTNETYRRFVSDILEIADTDEFCHMFSYQRGDFTNVSDYKALGSVLEEVDAQWGMCANKLFYVAASPSFYEEVLERIAESELTRPCSPEEGFTRVLIEKPMGKSAREAERIDALLETLFREIQIYRIDHYLAKDMLQNILSFRFSNNILEHNWNGRAIESVHITLLETIGVEKRGAFYDGLGALRDVGQNHLLQMLALVAMDHPSAFSADAIRRKRTEILENLITPSREYAAKHSFRAQYEGYKGISGVSGNSDTETYFALRAYLSSPEWKGVPFVLESGKRMGDVRKEIVVTFRHPDPCLCPSSDHYRNVVRIMLEPNPGITITFWSKKQGLVHELEEQSLDFFLTSNASTQYVVEYEKLLMDCIEGDQTLFLSSHELREMWRFVDPIIDAWDDNTVPLTTYVPDMNDVRDASLHVREEISHMQDDIPHAIGIVGLGNMGGNISRRLSDKGWKVIGTDVSESACIALEDEGIACVSSLSDMVSRVSDTPLVLLMIPHEHVDTTLEELVPQLPRGSVVVDGGNSWYKDSIRRYKELQERGIHFVDVGISGGPVGALRGASLMIGGDRNVFERIEVLFSHMAQVGGYQFFEGAGAGHFVKMVHNGIEYGMMQAIAEGFDIMKHSSYAIDVSRVAEVYNRGSVIESRLIGWLEEAFVMWSEDLSDVSGSVSHSGMGEWTVREAEREGIRAKVIQEALAFREYSQDNPGYAGRVLTALRNRFGRHDI